jgi:hypothetical protein
MMEGLNVLFIFSKTLPQLMHTFTTRKDGFKEVRNQAIGPLISIYGVFLICMAYFILTDVTNTEGHLSLLLTLALVIPLLIISGVSAIRRQKKLFESFRLIITEDSISREQINTPTITLHKDRVREIRKLSNGTICIIGDSKLNVIGVPKQIERGEELERLLSEIKPLTTKNHGAGRAYLQVFLALLCLGLAGAGMASEDEILSSFSAIVICAMLIVSFVVIQLSKNADKRMKRLSYFTIIPLIVITYYVVMGWTSGG